MDPIVDTHDEGPLEAMPNAVQPTGAEANADTLPHPPPGALAPELFPDGAIDDPAAANPFPGQAEAEHVKHAGVEEPGRADTQPDPFNELPVPPPQFHHDGDDDDDQDMGDDLFGDAGDDDDDDDHQLAAARALEPAQQPEEEEDDGLTAEERARRRALEYDEEEITGDMMDHDPVQMEQQQLVTAELPLANVPVPAGGKIWHARMPNFLEIRSKPFDEEEWDPKEEDLEAAGGDDQGGGEGAAASQQVKQRMVPDENVIRWRWTKDQLGQVVKQSNARIVRWSDGSLSLQLGAELFDMTLTLDHSAVLSSSTASGLPVPPPVNSVTAGLTASSFDTSRGHGLTYLTARHAYTGSVIEAHASVHGAIAFRPATIASQTHKRLAGMVAQRQAAAKGRSTIAAAMPEMDPELQRQQQERKKNEAIKKAKREAAKLKAGGKSASGARRAGAKKATRLEGLSDDDDDDDTGAGEDEDGYGGYARRSQPRRGRGGPLAARDYSDDDDDDEGFVAKSDEEMEEVSDDGPQDEIEAADEAAERAQRRRKERARQDADNDADAAGAAEESEGEAAAPRRRMVIESDEEE
ncbi:Leo1-domain-containing protein [Rhodotorula sp. JG-1b]|nr:Leo1-domain-containing protein [Rhodotorula sp. JG-1b]